jgi:hypothetical protein
MDEINIILKRYNELSKKSEEAVEEEGWDNFWK